MAVSQPNSHLGNSLQHRNEDGAGLAVATDGRPKGAFPDCQRGAVHCSQKPNGFGASVVACTQKCLPQRRFQSPVFLRTLFCAVNKGIMVMTPQTLMRQRASLVSLFVFSSISKAAHIHNAPCNCFLVIILTRSQTGRRWQD